jgi:hypothetical protein
LSKGNSKSESYDRLVDKLFLVPNVRYAVVADDLGNRYFGGMKAGVQSTTPLDIEKRLEVQAVLILKMAQGYEPFDGKLYYCSIRWEKVLAYFFLLDKGDRILAVTLNAKASPQAVNKIRALVRKWE